MTSHSEQIDIMSHLQSPTAYSSDSHPKSTRHPPKLQFSSNQYSQQHHATHTSQYPPSHQLRLNNHFSDYTHLNHNNHANHSNHNNHNNHNHHRPQPNQIHKQHQHQHHHQQQQQRQKPHSHTPHPHHSPSFHPRNPSNSNANPYGHNNPLMAMGYSTPNLNLQINSNHSHSRSHIPSQNIHHTQRSNNHRQTKQRHSNPPKHYGSLIDQTNNVKTPISSTPLKPLMATKSPNSQLHSRHSTNPQMPSFTHRTRHAMTVGSVQESQQQQRSNNYNHFQSPSSYGNSNNNNRTSPYFCSSPISPKQNHHIMH
eukprot:229971_1